MSEKMLQITKDLKALGVTNVILSNRANRREEFKAIKKSYHARALSVHPDKGGSSSAFHEVQEAYERLECLYNDGQVASFLTYLLAGSAWRSLPRSRYVYCDIKPGGANDMLFYAEIPKGLEMGQHFLAEIGGGIYRLRIPSGHAKLIQQHNILPTYVPFYVSPEVVAKNLSHAKHDDKMHKSLKAHLHLRAKFKAEAAKRKKERDERVALRISELVSNGRWRSALAAGELDTELNDVLKGVLDHLGKRRSGRKVDMLERLKDYVAKEKENEGMHPKGGRSAPNKRKLVSSENSSSTTKARRAFGDVGNESWYYTGESQYV